MTPLSDFPFAAQKNGRKIIYAIDNHQSETLLAAQPPGVYVAGDIFFPIESGHVQQLEAVLCRLRCNSNFSINTERNIQGYAPLHLAIELAMKFNLETKWLQIIEALIKHGADTTLEVKISDDAAEDKSETYAVASWSPLSLARRSEQGQMITAYLQASKFFRYAYPEFLSRPKSLTSIDFSALEIHKLDNEWLKTLFQVLNQPQSLQWLSLQKINLGKLADDCFSTVVQGLSQSQNLQFVSFDLIDFIFAQDNARLSALLEALNRCQNLRSLDLSHNSIHGFGGDIEPLRLTFEAISTWQNLEVINLNTCVLEEAGNAELIIIFQALKQCRNLQAIDLGMNSLAKLDDERLATIFQGLSACQNLRSISLKNTHLNSLSDQQLTDLLQALGNCRNLQALDLSRNYLGTLSNEQLTIIFQALSIWPNLQAIDLEDNYFIELNNEKIRILFDALNQCLKLQSINLANNRIGELNNACLTTIFSGLSNCQNLELIDFSMNSFGHTAIEHLNTLFQTLGSLQNLKSINLYLNGLSMQDYLPLVIISEALSQCQNLQAIGLKSTIGDIDKDLDIQRFKRIFEAFGKHPSLQLIDLRETFYDLNNEDLNNKRITTICEFLSKLPNLDSINLEDILDTKWSDATFNTICQGLALCHNLTQVTLRNRTRTSPFISDFLSDGVRRESITNICKQNFSTRIKAIATASIPLIKNNIPPEITEKILSFAYPMVKREAIMAINVQCNDIVKKRQSLLE